MNFENWNFHIPIFRIYVIDACGSGSFTSSNLSRQSIRRPRDIACLAAHGTLVTHTLVWLRL
jgi:hypothetical protein